MFGGEGLFRLCRGHRCRGRRRREGRRLDWDRHRRHHHRHGEGGGSVRSVVVGGTVVVAVVISIAAVAAVITVTVVAAAAVIAAAAAAASPAALLTNVGIGIAAGGRGRTDGHFRCGPPRGKGDEIGRWDAHGCREGNAGGASRAHCSR